MELTLGDSLETTTAAAAAAAAEPLAGRARKLAADAVPSKREGDLVFFELANGSSLVVALVVPAPLAVAAVRFFFAAAEPDGAKDDAAPFRLAAVAAGVITAIFRCCFLAFWLAPLSDDAVLAFGRLRLRGVATPLLALLLLALPRAVAPFFAAAPFALLAADDDAGVRARLAGVFLLDFLRPPLEDVVLFWALCRRLVRLAAAAAAAAAPAAAALVI